MDETNNIPNPYDSLNTTSQHAPVTPAASTSATGTSKDTKTIVSVLLLIFLYPIGFFVMWFWSGWKVWVKLLVSFFGTLASLVVVGILILPIILIAVNPSSQIQKAACTKLCQETYPTDSTCVAKCLETQRSTGTKEETGTAETFRSSYMNTCLSSSGDKQDYCECTLEYLEGVVDFNNPAALVTNLPKEVPNAIKACQDRAL